ncbi:MarR family winged helix-turn-helix transcriptional regulator [Reinekea thalattae]|uniref:MarR family transcriptional regulator n=1 Tax=Reinekea thalattae TaxID=2593301 RepID=A0A5C8ZB94_9GAMM|nr:MarR family transcriptional regulator [Reinekea thalattae]TXR54461.1 MarR family transcriptional regulator [Reinekea thalattae]
MDTPKQLKLENQICHSIYSAANALVRSYRPLLEALELTYPQYLVMLSLWQQDDVIIKDLVEHTRFDAGTLTPMLARLESKGLIQRHKSASDSRQKRLLLTAEGQALREKAASIPEALACRVNMEVDEARQLKQLTEKLYRTLTDLAAD